jgi:hypothetical protein
LVEPLVSVQTSFWILLGFSFEWESKMGPIPNLSPF